MTANPPGSGLRLWMLTLNYAPEPTGFAPHATALAEHLAHRGHVVSAVTGFPFAPRWRRWPEYRGQWMSRSRHNGVALTRVSHFIPRHPGATWQRLLMEGSFCLAALIAVLPSLRQRRNRPAAILYVGAQPSIAMLARILARLSGARYFVNVNDLAARAAADVGIVRAGWLQRCLERFEFSAYRGAAGATVLCDSFGAALVARGFPLQRIRCIRSPIDLEQIRPLTAHPDFRRELGMALDRFVVLFAGSMGLKQGLQNVIEAAAQRVARPENGRKNRPPVTWVLVGDGEMRHSLEQLAARYRLGDAVLFLPFQPEARMARMFAAADVLLLNQVATVKDTVVPSKLLTYMAAGRPVLAAVNAGSQGAELLHASGGGLLVRPDDPLALLNGVDMLVAAGADVLTAMGGRNRAYAEREFDQRTILAAHESFIIDRLQNQVAGLPRPRQRVITRREGAVG